MRAEQVTLAEASVRLGVPLGTLYVWKASERIHATGIVSNPRPTAVFDLDELTEIVNATRRRARHAIPVDDVVHEDPPSL